MKKTAVTIIVLFAACVIALICILYFRGNGQDKDAPTFEEVTDTDGMDTGIPIRDGEPDEDMSCQRGIRSAISHLPTLWTPGN